VLIDMQKLKSRMTIILMLGFLISACGTGEGDASPTLAPEEIQTQAVATFAAGLTETTLANPTETPTATLNPSPIATDPIAATSTVALPVVPTAGGGGAASCKSMAFVSDITIPDNTELNPGEAFTKTWRVRNNGSCEWDNGDQFRFVGGEAMGGEAVTLDSTVSPGEEIELSVAMKAPDSEGTYQGNWRMSVATGAFFGDEVFVLIEVSGTAESNPTATTDPATATPSETPTETTTP
jgi:hypothetical protein